MTDATNDRNQAVIGLTAEYIKHIAQNPHVDITDTQVRRLVQGWAYEMASEVIELADHVQDVEHESAN